MRSSRPKPASFVPQPVEQLFWRFATAPVSGMCSMQAAPWHDSSTRCEAFTLAAALGAFEVTCAKVIETWFDMNLYADAGISIAAIRQHGISNPALAVLALHLAVAHAELQLRLWQQRVAGTPHPNLAEVRDRHANCLLLLQNAALRQWRTES
jgi:hypothetical protein